METSIETINGKLYTIVRHEFEAWKVRESLSIGVPVLVEIETEGSDRGHHYRIKFIGMDESSYHHVGGSDWASPDAIRLKNTLAILPALPRHPKPEDAALLYRYASEGIFAYYSYEDLHSVDESIEMGASAGLADLEWILSKNYKPEFTHAVDTEGNTIEIALEDK